MCTAWKNPKTSVNIALVGKYTQLHDAYISVVEALKHGGVFNYASVNIKWVDSELLNEANISQMLNDVSGILVPGGFGDRGIEGMILAARYARENNIPYLGLWRELTISEEPCALVPILAYSILPARHMSYTEAKQLTKDIATAMR